MYGGTAKTYATWKIKGEPFTEYGRTYVVVINPKTALEKTVRWYCDEAHARLMPKRENEEFCGKHFGFEDAADYIIAFRECDLSEKEIAKYFNTMEGNGRNWRNAVFCDGIWYATKDTEIPPVENADKAFRITWPQLVEAGRRENRRHYGRDEGYWFTVSL